MIPLRDINPTSTKPLVVYSFVALNAVVWLFEASMLHTGRDVSFTWFIERYGVTPLYLLSGEPGVLITPLTSMFMHGGWLHFLGNMLFLWVFGDNVEDRLGKGRFILFYLLCGLAAVIGQTAIDPDSTVPMVGASGAIAGVLAGYVRLFPHARVLTLVPIFIFLQFIELPAYFFIFIWFAMQLLQGFTSLGLAGDSMGGVAFFAHIGGFLAGLILVKPLARAHSKLEQGRAGRRRRYGDRFDPWERS